MVVPVRINKGRSELHEAFHVWLVLTQVFTGLFITVNMFTRFASVLEFSPKQRLPAVWCGEAPQPQNSPAVQSRQTERQPEPRLWCRLGDMGPRERIWGKSESLSLTSPWSWISFVYIVCCSSQIQEAGIHHKNKVSKNTRTRLMKWSECRLLTSWWCLCRQLLTSAPHCMEWCVRLSSEDGWCTRKAPSAPSLWANTSSSHRGKLKPSSEALK